MKHRTNRQTQYEPAGATFATLVLAYVISPTLGPLVHVGDRRHYLSRWKAASGVNKMRKLINRM
jgi:hypothetical protein